MRVIDEWEDGIMVLHGDGEIDFISWSSALNVLVYKHDLKGLLVDGDETWTHETADGTVSIVPEEDAESFTVHIGDDVTVHLGPHRKSDLLRVLMEMYDADDPPDVQPLLKYVWSLSDTEVHPQQAAQFLDMPLFEDVVEETTDGWLIYGHLLLTYDNEFYQPQTRRAYRDGRVLQAGDNKLAYDITFPKTWSTSDAENPTLSDFEGGYFGDDAAMVEFLARALWAVVYAPEVTTTDEE